MNRRPLEPAKTTGCVRQFDDRVSGDADVGKRNRFEKDLPCRNQEADFIGLEIENDFGAPGSSECQDAYEDQRTGKNRHHRPHTTPRRRGLSGDFQKAAETGELFSSIWRHAAARFESLIAERFGTLA